MIYGHGFYITVPNFFHLRSSHLKIAWVWNWGYDKTLCLALFRYSPAWLKSKKKKNPEVTKTKLCESISWILKYCKTSTFSISFYHMPHSVISETASPQIDIFSINKNNPVHLIPFVHHLNSIYHYSFMHSRPCHGYPELHFVWNCYSAKFDTICRLFLSSLISTPFSLLLQKSAVLSETLQDQN